jgi:hypothetical protein
MIGAFTSGEKNENTPTTTRAAPQGIAIPSSQSGSGMASIAKAASFNRSAFRATCCAMSAPTSDAEGSEQEAEDMRIRAVVKIRERLNADDEGLRKHVDEASGEQQRAEQRIAREEADSGQHALGGAGLFDSLARAHEHRDDGE